MNEGHASGRSSKQMLHEHAEGISEVLAGAVESGIEIGSLCALVMETDWELYKRSLALFGYEHVADGVTAYGVLPCIVAAGLFSMLGKPEVATAIGEPVESGEVRLVMCCPETILVTAVCLDGPKMTSPGSSGMLS